MQNETFLGSACGSGDYQLPRAIKRHATQRIEKSISRAGLAEDRRLSRPTWSVSHITQPVLKVRERGKFEVRDACHRRHPMHSACHGFYLGRRQTRRSGFRIMFFDEGMRGVCAQRVERGARAGAERTESQPNFSFEKLEGLEKELESIAYQLREVE